MINLGKVKSLRRVLNEQNLESILLMRSANFAWLTDGINSNVGIASDIGSSYIYVNSTEAKILTTNIEKKRLVEEQKFSSSDILEIEWEKGVNLLARQITNLNSGSDYSFFDAKDINAQIAKVRVLLTPEDQDRYKILGQLASDSMDSIISFIKPGMTELEISSFLAGECLKREILPIVNLVAVDERVSLYGHPLPTQKVLRSYLVVILGVRRWGLVVSLTRFIHFGKIEKSLSFRMRKVIEIDSKISEALVVNDSLGNLYKKIILFYNESGFVGAEKAHHQGGITGYVSREFLAAPNNPIKINYNTAFAFNPSLTGVKSEDTLLMSEQGVSVLTFTKSWPLYTYNNTQRADILEILS